MRLVLPLVAVALGCGAAHAAPAALGPELSAQIIRCWTPPPGASGAVTLRFELRRDGTVEGTPRVSGLANAGFAESALAAVKRCQPYHLPPARFEDWQHAVVKLSVGGS
jgi:TonB family protein